VPEARFDATRLSWLGTPLTSVCFAYNSTRIKAKSLTDLYTNELHVGAIDRTAATLSLRSPPAWRQRRNTSGLAWSSYRIETFERHRC
jgi:hypothetical protein